MPRIINPQEIEALNQKQIAVMRGFLEGRRYFKAYTALELMLDHEKGFRKDGVTPKSRHQLSVARLVTTLDPHLLHPEETTAAAFLHDDLEDHGDLVTVDSLRQKFGTLVADAVWTLSKKTRGMTKTYEAYFGAMAECPIASIVKLADRIHNIQTMSGVFSPEKQAAYLDELDTWFFPMIRQARRNFPQQYGAYENLKHTLQCQAELIRLTLGG